ncbi:hypothetical protein NP493_1590g00049 [Ridgeia piscesae]|uniref:Uncharacterized protein n=1 Tax=Ridgeia piscesae TaxID=27915 RepID=A0AAD9JYD7_RIDPI|nr:hypothetical protein NP493_1590g00049 [Ridgeia piscesae]
MVVLSFCRPAVPLSRRPAVPPSRRPAVPPSRRPAVPPSRRPAVPPSRRPAVPPSRRVYTSLHLSHPLTRFFFAPLTKPGKCPRFTISRGRVFCPQRPVDKCRHDGDCPDKEKCCRRRRCGGLECVAPGGTDVCQLPKLPGPCKGSFLSWFYNVKTKKCETFIYGGCKGNGNRFKSKAECEKKCKPVVCSPIMCLMYCEFGFQLNSDGCPICKCLLPCQDVKCKSDEKCIVIKKRPPKAKCVKRVKPGTCPALPKTPPVRCAKPRHKCADDSDCPRRKKCCVNICLARTCVNPAVDVCQLPHRRGSCRKRLLRWYFDKRWNTCRKFVYRGCRGNGNRFETRQQCETKCNPSPCPVKSCALDCKYGLQLDGNGCPICKCLDPCKDVKCKLDERCQVQKPPCEKKPCPPAGVCVKVSKRVCSLPARGGPCFPPLMPWYYNRRRNVCRKFRKRCGRTGNRFASKQACEAVCKPPTCPPFECKLSCKFDFDVDTWGCPVCRCRTELCAERRCKPGTRCVLIQPDCVGCLPVPSCEALRKRGYCPASASSPFCAKPQRKCKADGDCPGTKKCCFVKACGGRVCMEAKQRGERGGTEREKERGREKTERETDR